MLPKRTMCELSDTALETSAAFGVHFVEFWVGAAPRPQRTSRAGSQRPSRVDERDHNQAEVRG